MSEDDIKIHGHKTNTPTDIGEALLKKQQKSCGVVPNRFEPRRILILFFYCRHAWKILTTLPSLDKDSHWKMHWKMTNKVCVFSCLFYSSKNSIMHWEIHICIKKEKLNAYIFVFMNVTFFLKNTTPMISNNIFGTPPPLYPCGSFPKSYLIR